MPRAASNPLLAPWRTPFEVPPFARIRPEHFRPAFTEALARHRAEVARIAGNRAKPTFRNTVVALEGAGRLLERVGGVFWNLTSADTSEALQEIEREMAPVLAEHWNAITANADLFRRVDAVYQARERLKLTAEERRLVERQHLGFVRAGAGLEGAAKERMGAVKKRLAELGTQFSQNVLADEKDFVLPLEGERDLAGLPGFLVAAARQAAAERGLEGHVVTLNRSLIEPFLTFSARRDLREQAFRAWISRGERGGASDNRAIIAETLALRQERARLLGYPSFAAFKLADTMAGEPAAVRGLLEPVWSAARAAALRERDKLAGMARREGANIRIEPWDWRYYAEKVRQAEHDLDEATIKAYLPLEQMLAAAFWTAGRLFGVTFTERTDIAGYHPDVRAWEVTDRDGRHVGLFLGDYFARPAKRSGAWMSEYRGQERLKADIRPIIVNVLNLAKGAPGEPTLLSLDDARTLFHELGHGLHGLLSQVTYPSLAGTSVARDFVELPSQLYEHWLLTGEVLERFARHHKTGKPMPKALIERIRKARTFNQGFATVEYVASALVDMDLHAEPAPDGADPLARERATLERIGMPREIVMRHRSPHFQHVFSGDGYSAGYYSYMWSEVLDADAFAAFEETGDVFDEATARRLKESIYAAGNSADAKDLWLAFRGKLPSVEGVIKGRGLG